METITVIGTVFVDSKGFVGSGYDPHGRNLGEIKFAYGGVARNVAENMALLGAAVTFAATTDETAIGQDISDGLRKSGVDTSYLKKCGGGTGRWMLLSDEKGSQIGSLSMMPDVKALEDIVLTFGDEMIKKTSYIVLEIDISEAITSTVFSLAEKYGKKVFVLPANLSSTLDDSSYLQKTECFICNHIEAGKLFKTDTKDKTPQEMLVILKDGMNRLGIPSMVITMGTDGAVYCSKKTGEEGHEPAILTSAVDTAGAGDSFVACAVCSLSDGCSLADSVKYATRLASLTVTCDENVYPDIKNSKDYIFGRE